MDDAAKKTALRMIPYGIYVMTAEADGAVAAATVNWVTQTSFSPPLVAVGAAVERRSDLEGFVVNPGVRRQGWVVGPRLTRSAHATHADGQGLDESPGGAVLGGEHLQQGPFHGQSLAHRTLGVTRQEVFSEGGP